MTQIKQIFTDNIFRKTATTFFTLMLQGMYFCAISQSVDTIQIKQLQEVNITEKAIKKEVYSATPLQVMDASKIERLNVTQLSDAVKFFSGATVKDYGGVGGMKTVSVRGFGATHTGVSYDGIPVSDGVSGQIDLGRFSLNNVSLITLSAGQSDDIFQPARLFASAAVLKIQSSTPDVSEEKKANVNAELKAGSFGLWNPLLYVEGRLGNSFSASAHAEYLTSRGNYPFTLRYGTSESDSTSYEKRENSDVETWRTEIALFGKLKKSQQLRLQCSYYQSERGLPGATTFYYIHSKQRLWDKLFFSQLHYEKQCGHDFSFQINGKYNRTFQHYRNPDSWSSDSTALENNYYQNEGYGSATVLYTPADAWSFSLANDVFYNDMDSDLPAFAYPERYTWLAVAAGKFNKSYITVTANILSTVVREYVHYKDIILHGNRKAPDSERFSPAFSVAIRPFQNEEFNFRLMYKEIFRMPSFNDLYYSQVGNPDLKPEYTWQYNVGISYNKKVCAWMPQITAIADIYYNKVENKILAVPTKNIFEWSMKNVGKVDIYGVDFNLDTYFVIVNNFRFLLNATYSYQKALDVTSETDPIYSKLYKHQIPYTPEHSGGGAFTFENPYLNFSYSVICSGSRYSLGQNIPENYLKPYSDHSISIGKQVKWRVVSFSGKFEILNLFDEQYEIVRYFPMQGRAWRVSIGVKW